MLTNVCQRWREHRSSYRPAGEVIATSRHEVAPIADDKTARTFIETHHYSGTYPAAQYRYGLYEGGELVGVAVFSVPCNDKALACLPGSPRESTELGRLVLLDRVPGNGESWFVARCFEDLRRKGLVGIISLSDPIARSTADGRTTFRGHVGTIYQALNGVYLGRATPRTLRLLPDGTVLSDRALQKFRSKDKGWRYVLDQLQAAGAPALVGEDTRAYAREWVPRVTRPLRHPGNHKYAWVLDKRQRRALPSSLPYPKFAAAAA